MPGGFSRPLGGFALPGGGFVQSRGGFAQAGGGFVYPLAGSSPLSIFGSSLEFWARADTIAAADLSGSDIVTWRDLSGKGRDLTQATSARCLQLVSGVINGRPVARPGIAGDDRFMSWTPWAAPSITTLYTVARFRSKAAAYQLLVYAPGTNFTGLYLGGNPTQDRPMVFTNANIAEWGAALTDQTNYLIKFSWADASDTCTTRVNAAAEVSQVSGVAFTGSVFTTLGFDPAVSATQDLFSDIGDLWIVSGDVTAAQDTAVHNYVRSFWGAFF